MFRYFFEQFGSLQPMSMGELSPLISGAADAGAAGAEVLLVDIASLLLLLVVVEGGVVSTLIGTVAVSVVGVDRDVLVSDVAAAAADALESLALSDSRCRLLHDASSFDVTILLPLPFLSLPVVCNRFFSSTPTPLLRVTIRLALTLLFAFESTSLAGESHNLGGAQSCFVQSNRAPTYVLPRHVTFTTRIPPSVSCQTIPSRVTLVPGSHGPRHSGSVIVPILVDVPHSFVHEILEDCEGAEYISSIFNLKS